MFSPALQVMALIISIFGLIILFIWSWIAFEYWKEFKKICGSINHVEYLLYVKKRLELKSIECQSYKEELCLKIRENSLLRKRAESIAKERDEKK